MRPSIPTRQTHGVLTSLRKAILASHLVLTGPRPPLKGSDPLSLSLRPLNNFLVKQAIEVRASQQGVKAKWVRIELRKVEVLPGGGQAGTFFDYVGPSPINLWTGPDGEYGVLRPVASQFFFLYPIS